jgi:hypothetical protein
VRRMKVADLVRLYPTLYHMAEDGTWPLIHDRGLLSTEAIVDKYQPAPEVRSRILDQVRRESIVLTNAEFGTITIRDQLPLKFLDRCVTDGTTPRQFLDALNGRVFFWLDINRLRTLLGARRYRTARHVVLCVDTARLLRVYGPTVQLAPYNTGSMHVPTAPKRGADVFTDVADYPYEHWRAKRGTGSTGAVVELTVPYAVPDIADLVDRVEVWEAGDPVATLFQR